MAFVEYVNMASSMKTIFFFDARASMTSDRIIRRLASYLSEPRPFFFLVYVIALRFTLFSL